MHFRVGRRLLPVGSATVVAALFLLALPASAFTTPTISAELVGDFVDGGGFTPGATLTVKAFDAALNEVLSKSIVANPGGGFFIDLDPLDLIPGMSVRVIEGPVETPDVQRDLVLAPLAITSVNFDDDIVSGTATDGTDVNINVSGPGGNASHTETASGGTFTFDFTGLADIVPGSGVSAAILDGDGDSTRVDRGPANIGADLLGDSVDGGGFAPGAALTVKVFDNLGGEVASRVVTASDEGRFFTDFDPLDLAPAMSVQVIEGPVATPVQVKDLTLVPLAITGVFLADDRVTGTADSGTFVNINVGGPTGGAGDTVEAVGGNWEAFFAGDVDIVSGSGISAFVPDPDGDATRVGRGPANIFANITGNFVDGGGFAPNASLTVRAFDNIGNEITSSTTPATIPASEEGTFFIDLDPLDLTPGMSVQVTDGLFTKDLTLSLLTISTVDAGTNVVTGTATNGTTVVVDAFGQNGPGATKDVQAQPGDTWSVDFTGSFDISGTSGVNALIPDPDGDGTRASRGPAVINGDLPGDNVQVNGYAANTPGTLTITGLDGSVPFNTDAQGNAFISRQQHTVDLVPGLTVTATQGTISKSVLLANLSITEVDPDDDVVSGTADSATVDVNVFGPTGWSTTVDVVGGAWSHDFTGQVDITYTHVASAAIRDPEGDSTTFGKSPPTIEGDLSGDNVRVNGYAANTPGTLTITGLAGSVPFNTDAQGNAFISRQQHTVDLVPGLTVTATQGILSKSVLLANLSITSVDPDQDVVSGTADSATVAVNVFGPTGWSTTVDVVGGAWSHDFTGQVDITYAHNGGAAIRDPEGDSTSVGKSPSTIGGDLSGDNINVFGFPANSLGSLTISGKVGSVPVNTDGAGNAFIGRQQHGEDLTPGRTIDVTVGSVNKAVTLANLSITSVNIDTNVVSGTADTATVDVNVFGPTGGAFQVVNVSGNAWSHDFTGQVNIDFTHNVTAQVRDPEGDSTSFGKSPSTIGGDLSGDNINVFGFPANSLGSLTISGKVGSVPVNTDGAGNAFIGRDQHGEDLTPGRTIDVTVGSVNKAVTLANLSITEVDPDDDVVSGTADSATVDVDIFGPAGGAHQTVDVVGGAWTWDFTGQVNIGYSHNVTAQVRDPEGDSTSFGKSPSTIGGDLSGDNINVFGFPANSLGSLTISGKVGSVPVNTDGAGNAFIGRDQHGEDLTPGRTIDVTVGSVNKAVTLANLSITAIDIDEDVVSGTADTATVDVNVFGPGFGAFQTVDVVGGGWSWDFTDQVNITFSHSVNAQVRDPEGDSTSFFKNPPTIDADMSFDNISVNEFPANTAGTLTISGKAESVPFETGPQGNAFIGFEDHGEDLFPGRTIDVTVGTVHKDLTLANLSITEVDPNDDSVSGTADVGTNVHVNVGNESGGSFKETTAVAGNTWTVFFAPFNITSNTGADAHVRDLEGDTTSVGAQPATIQGDLSFDQVEVNGFAPNTTGGTLNITGMSEPFVFNTDGGGHAFIDREQHGIDLVPGLTVDVTVGGASKSLLLENLSIISVDPGTEIVRGTADDLAVVNFTIGDETTQFFQEIDPAADDTWSIDLTGDFNIGRYGFTDARIADPEGDSTSFGKGSAIIDGDLTFDNVDINNFAATTAGTLTITGAPDPIPFTTDGEGNAYIDQSQHGVDLQQGVTLQATQGTLVKAVTLENLTITNVDEDPLNNVAGAADATRPGRVEVFNDSGDAFEDFTTQGGGTWSVHFDDFNIDSSTGVQAHIPDLEGDGTKVSRRSPRINAHPNDDFIGAEEFPPLATLTFEIYDTEGGTLLVDPAPQRDADQFGNAFLGFEDHGQNLAGRFIRVSGGGFTKELTVADLAITGIDTDGDRVRMAAPGASSVFVFVEGPTGEEQVEAQDPETDGIWIASFSVNLVGNSFLSATIPDDDGDRTEVNANGPVVFVDMTDDSINAVNFPTGGTLTFEVYSSEGGSLLTNPPITRPSNVEGVSIGPADHGQDLQDPIFVRVSDGFGTKEVTLVSLTIDVVNPTTDVVSGTAAEGTPIRVSVPFIQELDRCCPDLETTAVSGDTWSVDFTDFPDDEIGDVLQPANVAFAMVRDGDGDESQVHRNATEENSETLPSGGGEVNTDPEGDGATPSDPVETSVTTTDGGTVTITETAVTTPEPDTFSFLGQQIDITAPPGTVNDPLVLVFRIDASLIPEGEDALTIQVFRNGVPVDPCNQSGNAVPNPCVSARQNLPDGDAEITVLTTDASAWNFGVGGGSGPAPELALSSATYSIGESGGTATITVVRTGGTGPVAVTHTASNGTATGGQDFTAASGVLSFTEGETSKIFEIPILDDDRFEGSETVQIALSSPTGGAQLLSPSTATLTITDNDTVPVLQFSASSLSAGENAGTAELTVTRTGATDNIVQVDYALGPGTATAGSDFTLAPGTLTFGAGETGKVISIPIIDDTTGESAETLLVRLSNAGGGALLGSPDQSTVEIQVSDQQPDVLVGLKDSNKFLKGDDIYNTDAAGQSVSASGQPGQTKTFFARICNDGTQTNTLTVNGTSAAADSSIKYVKGNENITIAMTSADGYSVTLGKGLCMTIKILITVGASATSDVIALVTASWSGDGLRQDTAKATVLVP